MLTLQNDYMAMNSKGGGVNGEMRGAAPTEQVAFQVLPCSRLLPMLHRRPHSACCSLRRPSVRLMARAAARGPSGGLATALTAPRPGLAAGATGTG